MKKNHYPLLILLLAVTTLHAQQFQLDYLNYDGLAAPSPGTVFNPNINESTGKISVQIPFFRISHKDFSMPIGLHYSNSGIRVDESSSRVGLGWSLMAGGSITHVVCGIPDDDPTKGSLLPGVKSFLNNPTRGIMGGIYKGEYDGESDYYLFQAGPISGRFFFKDGVYHQMPMGPEKIARGTFLGKENSWHITDGNGIQYFFTEVEKTSLSDNNRISTVFTDRPQTWMLTLIRFPDQREVAFDYSPEYSYWVKGGLIERAKNLKLPTFCYSAYTNASYIRYEIWHKYKTKRLQRIRYPEGFIEFQYASSPREDVTDDHALVSVCMRNSIYQIIQRYNLNYYYKTRTGVVHSSVQSKRMMLQSVTQVVNENGSLPPYTFSYNDGLPEVCLPSPGTASQDLYGYFNNENFNSAATTGYLPTLLTTFSYQYKDPPTSSGFYTDVLDGATRAVHSGYAQAMILKKIVYPSGAIKEFDFESNRVTDPATNTEVIGAGLRVSRITTDDGNGNKLYTKYTYTNGVSTERKTFLVKEVNAYAWCYVGSMAVDNPNNIAYVRMSSPRQLIPGLYASQVYYGEVTREETDASGNALNGKTVTRYYAEPLRSLLLWEQLPGSTSMGWRDTRILLAQPFFYGAPLKVSIYKKESQNFELIRETTNEYNFDESVHEYVFGLYARPVSNNDTYFKLQYEGDILTDGFFSARYCSQFFHIKSSTQKEWGTTGTHFSTTRKEYQFEDQNSAKHFAPVYQKSTLADGNTLTLQYRRASDFFIPGSVANESVNALLQLQLNNQFGEVVETVSWKNQGQPNAQILGATLKEFTFPLFGKLLIEEKKTYALKRISSSGSFSYASVSGNNFIKSSAYYLVNEVTKFGIDGQGIAFKTRSESSSMITDAKQQHTIASILYAEPAECAYASFEDWELDSVSGAASGYFPLGGFHTSYATTARASEGFSGSRALQLNANCSLFLSPAVQITAGKNYLLTLRCKNGMPTVATGNSILITVNPTVLHSNKGWTLVQYELNGTAPPMIFGNCLIDEVKWHPANAQMATDTYDRNGQKVSASNPNHQHQFQNYDNLGRPYRQSDTDGKLLKQYSYGNLEIQP